MIPSETSKTLTHRLYGLSVLQEKFGERDSLFS